MQVGVQRKLTSHLAGCRSAGVEFIPIVAETLGVLAEDTIHVIRSFGEAIAQRVGPQDSTNCTKHLFHCVATALWRGNSTLWMHRLELVIVFKDFGALHELELAEKHLARPVYGSATFWPQECIINELFLEFVPFCC